MSVLSAAPMTRSTRTVWGGAGRMPALLRDRRAPLARSLFRLPVVLYRLGVGHLLGHQFLLLTHAGRRTGRVRETALKVLRFDPATGESVVASAWGPATDWYRNITARPALAERTGRDCSVPQQRLVPPEEAYAAFDAWTRRQPAFARLMLGQIGVSWDVPEVERRALIARFPFVGFRPLSPQDAPHWSPDGSLDGPPRRAARAAGRRGR